MRFRSRSGVCGSCHNRGKSVASEDPRTGVGVDSEAVRLPLPFVDRLRIGDLLERAIPVGFQFVGDEPIRGIDLQVAAAGEIRLVARALDGAAMQPIALVEPRLELVLDRQGDLQGQRGVTVSSSTRPIA